MRSLWFGAFALMGSMVVLAPGQANAGFVPQTLDSPSLVQDVACNTQVVRVRRPDGTLVTRSIRRCNDDQPGWRRESSRQDSWRGEGWRREGWRRDGWRRDSWGMSGQWREKPRQAQGCRTVQQRVVRPNGVSTVRTTRVCN